MAKQYQTPIRISIRTSHAAGVEAMRAAGKFYGAVHIEWGPRDSVVECLQDDADNIELCIALGII